MVRAFIVPRFVVPERPRTQPAFWGLNSNVLCVYLKVIKILLTLLNIVSKILLDNRLKKGNIYIKNHKADSRRKRNAECRIIVTKQIEEVVTTYT